jgi:phosphatidylserine/phosphatidylglycerophosphate/cardiolipin synthase-like enzyme
MKIFFLKPRNNVNDKSIAELLKIINNDGELIRIAISYFVHLKISEAIIGRCYLQRKTRILFNANDLIRPCGTQNQKMSISFSQIELFKSQLKQSKYLEIRIAGEKTDKVYENMHHKYIVSNNKLIYGSPNWTDKSFNNSYEFLVLTKEKSYITKFQEEFDEIWKIAKKTKVNIESIISIYCPLCNNQEAVNLNDQNPYCKFCNYSFSII